MGSLVRFAMALALGVVVLLAMLFSALRSYDEHLYAVAQRDLQHLVDGQSPFSWAFDGLAEVDESHDLGSLTVEAGALRATLGRDPYFYLRKGRRLIDAERYRTLVVSLDVSETVRLRVYHQLPFSPSVVVSEPIAVPAGTSTLALDLAALVWREIAGRDVRHAGEGASTWGGPEQVVSRIGLHFPGGEGVQVRIDSVELADRGPRLPASVQPQAIDLLSDAWPNTVSEVRMQRHRPPVLVDVTHLRTPESSAAMRDQLLLLAPAAVVFPSPADHSTTVFRYQKVVRFAAAHWVGLSLAVTLALVGLWRWGGRDWGLSPGARASVELLILLPLLVLVLVLFQARGWVLLPLGLFMAALLLRLSAEQGSWRQQLTGPSETGTAWLATGVITLPPLVWLLVVGEPFSSGLRELALAVLVYTLWGLVQQFLLGPVLAWRLSALPGIGYLAPVLAAGIFGFGHYPNFGLMAGTFVMGVFWAAIYLRHRALLPLALSHGVLGVVLREVAPDWLRRSGEIGVGYFAWTDLG